MNDLKSLQDALESSEKQIKILNEEIVRITKSLNEEREIRKKLEESLFKSKLTIETQRIRLDSINYIEKLNNAQSSRISNLEDQLVKEKDTQMKLDHERKLDNDFHLSKMKKKSLDMINQIKRDYEHSFKENLNSNNKITILQNSELISELCRQSIQIEELIKEKFCLEEIIKTLKSDIKIHFELEKLLSVNNAKYHNIVKEMNSKGNENQNDDTSQKFNRSSNLSIKSLFGNKVKTIKLSNNNELPSKENNLLLEVKIKTLEKEINKSKLNYQQIKTSYDVMSEKLKNFEKKYGNLFSLIDDGLRKITENKKIIYFKEKLDEEKIKNCEFSHLTNDQKYTILQVLMDYLMPLITTEISNEKRQNSLNYYGNKSRLITLKTPISLKKTGSQFFKIPDRNQIYTSFSRNISSERLISK